LFGNNSVKNLSSLSESGEFPFKLRFQLYISATSLSWSQQGLEELGTCTSRIFISGHFDCSMVS
jgi:hypothetical protein